MNDLLDNQNNLRSVYRKESFFKGYLCITTPGKEEKL